MEPFFTPRYGDGEIYITTCLLFTSHTIHTSENNSTVQCFVLNKTSSGTYIPDEDLLRSKCCTVLLFSDVHVCIVSEINNKQVLTYILPLQYLGAKKRSNDWCNCHAKAL